MRVSIKITISSTEWNPLPVSTGCQFVSVVNELFSIDLRSIIRRTSAREIRHALDGLDGPRVQLDLMSTRNYDSCLALWLFGLCVNTLLDA